jgi:hypothetical protein
LVVAEFDAAGCRVGVERILDQLAQRYGRSADESFAKLLEKSRVDREFRFVHSLRLFLSGRCLPVRGTPDSSPITER